MAKFIAQADVTTDLQAANDATPKAITPRYASPELAAGEDPEPADDVYALACIAYEALCGKHPFGRDTDPRIRGAQFRLTKHRAWPPINTWPSCARWLSNEATARPASGSFSPNCPELIARRAQALGFAVGGAGCGDPRGGLRGAFSSLAPAGRSDSEPQRRRYGDSRLPHVPADDGFADGKLRTGERKCNE